MKNILIFKLLFASLSVFCQTVPSSNDTLSNDEKVYEMFDIQEPPSFPGGEKELVQYVNQNLHYPIEASKKKISGVVALQFIVNTDGSISDVRILKEIGGGCGEEAKRVVESMPKWIPGKLRGKSVRVLFTLPVRFRPE